MSRDHWRTERGRDEKAVALPEVTLPETLLPCVNQEFGRLSALFHVIRAPRGVGTLRTMTRGSPVPPAGVTDEDIQAEGFSCPQLEPVQQIGLASFRHFVQSCSQGNNTD